MKNTLGDFNIYHQNVRGFFWFLRWNNRRLWANTNMFGRNPFYKAGTDSDTML